MNSAVNVVAREYDKIISQLNNWLLQWKIPEELLKNYNYATIQKLIILRTKNRQ